VNPFRPLASLTWLPGTSRPGRCFPLAMDVRPDLYAAKHWATEMNVQVACAAYGKLAWISRKLRAASGSPVGKDVAPRKTPIRVAIEQVILQSTT
jgi:hypothetical protein